MTETELHAFLTDTAILAMLGSIESDGWPTVTPVLYEYDSGAFYVVTKELAGFCQNLRRDARATITVANPEPPYKRVVVKGEAEFPDEDWADRMERMILRYLGPLGLEYLHATRDLPRVVMRLKPRRFVTWNGAGIDRTFERPAHWNDIGSSETLEEVVASSRTSTS